MSKRIIAILIIIGIVSSMLLLNTSCNRDIADIEYHTVGDGMTLNVGIISDIHMPTDINGSDYTENLEATLNIFKQQGIDVLVIAGDFTDLATDYAYQQFVDIYDSVFGEDKPIASFVMGNHDYWLKFGATVPKMRRRFTKYTGEKPFNHKVINGYHFIGWSSENGTYDKAYRNEKWVRSAIELAIEDNSDNPVFVTTHIHPKDTVYGSADWGNADVTSILKDYYQVISFSGHSHYSLLDERSIYQGDFTAVNTQTLSYIEMDDGYENGSIPRDYNDCSKISESNPMALIMTINSDAVTMQRVSILNNELIKDPWIVPLPISKDTFNYTYDKQKQDREKPVFATQDGVVVTQSTNIYGDDTSLISFKAAQHSDFVHSYN